MPVETPSLFAQVIQEHLALRERNSDLQNEMPLEQYKSEDPFDNHPLFKSEEQARLEETLVRDVRRSERKPDPAPILRVPARPAAVVAQTSEGARPATASFGGSTNR